MGEAARSVFGRWRYCGLTAAVALTVLTAFLWLPHTALVAGVLTTPELSVVAKGGFLFSLYGTWFSNYTALGAVYLLAVSLLIGSNVALLVFYLRHRVRRAGSALSTSLSITGLLAALFGVGCAACGSVLLAGLLSLIGAGGLLYVLAPYGTVFALVGLGLLVASNLYLLRQMARPATCDVAHGLAQN